MTNQPVIDALKTVLADSYALYLKTQNFHWNVTGREFGALHAMFQTQYEELSLAIDDIAERIRILGAKAPGGFEAFRKLSGIPEASGEEDASAMLAGLQSGHETVLQSLSKTLSAAQAAEDEGTVALISERIPVHEKTVWMLRASR